MEELANMKRYITFLRGVNISGKNKVPMAELKNGFEEIGFSEVRTLEVSVLWMGRTRMPGMNDAWPVKASGKNSQFWLVCPS